MTESTSQSTAFDFGKLVPGFDFLQNLTQAAGKNSHPTTGLGAWVAPTLNVEDIQKRIEELKAVLFWLEQNTLALRATIQALEVQKMTLGTLSAMKVNMGDLAAAFKLKPIAHPAEAAPAAQDKAPAASAAQVHAAPAAEAPAAVDKTAVDPLAWWGALSQQFQQIATQVMKDAPLQNAATAGLAAATKAVQVARAARASTAARVVKAATAAKTQPAAKTTSTSASAAGTKPSAKKKPAAAKKPKP